MAGTDLPAVLTRTSATASYSGRRSSQRARAASRFWNKGRVDVSLMRLAASSAVTSRYTTKPASRKTSWLAGVTTTPPPQEMSKGSGLAPSSRSTSVSMTRKPSSPPSAKISFTFLPSRRSM